MLTPSGKVMSEMTIACTSDNEFFLVTGGACDLHDIRCACALCVHSSLVCKCVHVFVGVHHIEEKVSEPTEIPHI